jgi:hypothetical protein
MTEIDLTQPADALWIPNPPITGGVISGGETKHFGQLRDAVRFIAEELEPRLRGTAWITTDAGSFTIGEIMEIHRKMKGGK